MIDAMTVTHELEHARACRLAAEAACCDLEELLWEMQRGTAIWRRLALIEGTPAAEPEAWPRPALAA
jgi:hypothetical protein